MPSPAEQQGLVGLPAQEGVESGTNLIVPGTRMMDRLAHFPEEVYDLSAESLLVRLAKVLLGDAGAGRLKKQSVLARLSHSIYGSHFYDLDRFYGAIFGGTRRIAEMLTGPNPQEEALTDEEWFEVAIKDDSFRSRMEQFARAVHYGPTAVGMEMVSEALLNVDCEVHESWVRADFGTRTYGDLEVNTYGDLEAQTYGSMEGLDLAVQPGKRNRGIFTIVPKRPITDEERHDLIRVLTVLKPATSIVKVDPLGWIPYTRVNARAAVADSEMWWITQSVSRPDAMEPDPKVRPPFSLYQGEAWSHIGGVAGVAAYTENADGTLGQFNIVGHVPYRSGGKVLTATYTPDLAIASLPEILGGRSVSDGILTINPYSGARRDGPIVFFYDLDAFDRFQDDYRPQRTSGGYQTAFYMDGYAAFRSGEAIRFPREANVVGHHKTRQSFYATPDRSPEDDTREVVETRLDAKRLINHVSVQVARFPQRVQIEAMDLASGQWRVLHRWTVHECVPERISDRPLTNDVHPQHSGNGHWMNLSATTDAIRSDRVRVVMHRLSTAEAVGPVNMANRPIPYSLAVRNLDVGYRIRGRRDIPTPHEDYGEGFASTINVRGEAVIMQVKERPASEAVDASSETYWSCEPQPTNRAVVSLYLDVRDGDGEGQTLDAFYLDPVKSGPHLNLYWSNSDDVGTFDAPDREVEVLPAGVTFSTSDGIRFGAAPTDLLSLSNDLLGFDPNVYSWQAGMRFAPHAAATAQEGRLALLSFGDLVVTRAYDTASENVTFGVHVNDGVDNLLPEVALNFPANSEVYLSLDYDHPTRILRLSVAYDDGYGLVVDTSETILPEGLSFGTPGRINIGGHSGPSGDTIDLGSNMTLTGLYLKVGEGRDPLAAVAEDFDSYVLPRRPGAITQDYTAGTILRYHPSFSTSEGTFGLRGGHPDLYATKEWTPIERDYRLQKGIIKVPPTKAKFWKFEFTNLVPEPIEAFIPIRRTVRMFPPKISLVNNPRPASHHWSGLDTAIEMAGNAQFYDTPVPRAAPWAPGYEPTAARYVDDARQPLTKRDASWLFGFQPWQVGNTRTPRWRETGRHDYDTFEVMDSSKIGYFVSVKRIQPLRIEVSEADNTRIYRESFHDDLNLNDGYTWDLNPGYMLASQPGAQVESRSFLSRHPVRAVQFSAHQSGPKQIVPDDDFRDQHALGGTNDWTRPWMWHRYGDAAPYYNPLTYSIRLHRFSGGPGSSGNGGTVTPPGSTPQGIRTLVRRPVRSIFSFRFPEPEPVDPEEPEPVVYTEGGLESPLVATSPRGMLHAAVRVVGGDRIANPLVLQIIGQDGSVLVEEARYIKPRETAEWYIGHQLGSIPRGEYQLFQRRSLVSGRPFRPILPNTQPAPTGETPTAAPDELVRIRIIQRGQSNDEWDVERLSLFDDGVLWEFSADGGETWHPALDINGNPDGVLSFPEPSTALRWRVTAYHPGKVVAGLQIRPWYALDESPLMSVPHRGPNVSSYDDESPIAEDPYFKRWHRPVPRWWWRGQGVMDLLPVPGQPISNEFSLFYARATADDVEVPTDGVTTDVMAVRFGYDSLGTDGFPIPGEVLPVPADQPSRGAAQFHRSGAEAPSVPDDDSFGGLRRRDGIMRPPGDHI